jgi:cytochrome c oxidase assembly protein subunit 15
MTNPSSSTPPLISRRHCYLLLASALMTYLLIVMGGVVCVTGSGGGCPDWPGCYGSIIPPLQTASIIEYLHRLVAGLAFVLIIGAAIVSWRKSAALRWVSWPALLAVVLLLVVSAFGAVAVLHGLPPGLAAVDLGSALVVLGLVSTAAVVAFAHRADPSLAGGLSGRQAFTRLVFWTMVAIYLVLVSGVLVAGKGSLTRCLGWPLWRALAIDLPGWPQLVRLVLASVAGLLVIAVVVQAWRTQRRSQGIMVVANVVGLLFLLEMLLGALMLGGNITFFMLIIYVAAAAALWVMIVVLAVIAGFTEERASRKA